MTFFAFLTLYLASAALAFFSILLMLRRQPVVTLLDVVLTVVLTLTPFVNTMWVCSIVLVLLAASLHKIHLWRRR